MTMQTRPSAVTHCVVCELAPPDHVPCASLLLQVRRTMDAHNHPALLLVDGVSSIGALVRAAGEVQKGGRGFGADRGISAQSTTVMVPMLDAATQGCWPGCWR